MRPNNLLKRERELRGWSQARVAEEIGTTALNVGRWERGTSMPYPYFREKLCALFGKDAEALGLLESESEPVEMSPASPDGAFVGSQPEKALYDPAIPLLPAGGARLVGRDDLLLSLQQRLCGGSRPVMVALHGLPGVGKTALAIELAYDPEVRVCFQHGVLWAGLGLKPDVTDLLSRWGALLNVSPEVGKKGGSEAWAKAIRTAIGQRQMLLVIDDAWEIEETLAFQVGGPCCAYLVTTRYPNLAVQVAADGAQAVPELTEKDGVTLLARYAAEFVKQAPETALALVHSVGALPLALTLIGKYLSVQVYSGQPRRLHAAVEHLRDAHTRLQLSETRSLAERHPSLTSGMTLSLQSVIAVSDQLLDEYTRSALRALSIFPAKPNSFAEAAALEVCQVPVEILDQLCDAGLLESNGPSRYMLHQTIADYARASLSDPAVSERLVGYYVCFVEENAGDHELLEPEISNILAALEVAHASHRREELVRGVCALAEFLNLRGLYSLAEKHLKRAYEAAQALGDDDRIVRTLLHLGPVVQSSGNLAQAEALLLEGLNLARKANNERQICDLLRRLGGIEDDRSNFALAETYMQEGLLLARKLGQQEQLCYLLTGLGVLAGKRGDVVQAEAYFREGLDMARHIGNQERIAVDLLDLGRVQFERGNYRESESYYRECLDVARRFGYDVVYGVALIYLGLLTMKQGRLAQSRDYLQDALAFLRRVNRHPWLEEALLFRGDLAAAEGDLEGAETFYREGLELAQRFEYRGNIGELYEALGRLETQRGNYEQAETYLRDALGIARELAGKLEICTALYSWGKLHLRRQRIDDASLNFVEMRNLTPKGQLELEVLALYGLACVAHARQNIAEARQQAETCLTLFTRMGHYLVAEIQDWLKTF